MSEQDRADIERLVDDPRHGATNRAVLWLLDEAERRRVSLDELEAMQEQWARGEFHCVQQVRVDASPIQFVDQPDQDIAAPFKSFAKAWEDAGVKSGGDDSFSRRIAEQSMAKHRAEQEAEQAATEAAIRQNERRRIAERLREAMDCPLPPHAMSRVSDLLYDLDGGDVINSWQHDEQDPDA